MEKQIKAIPKFADEQEERRFWETHDSTEYLDWKKAAHSRDVPYQSLINNFNIENIAFVKIPVCTRKLPNQMMGT